MKSNQQAEIIWRLHCAAGQVNAVIPIVETGQSCEHVLHQLNAVQAAIRAVGVKIIFCQAQFRRDIILNSPSPNERITELKRLQSLCSIFTRHFNNTSEVTHRRTSI